jgi:predicted nucleic acid-binding protein
MNTSDLNRPFDDLSAQKVRLQAESVASLLDAFESGRAELVASDYIDFEVSQIPDPERARRVRSLVGTARSRIRTSPAVAARARELERFGLRGLDALHVAAAEAATADALVTTDERMLRAAARVRPRLAVRVVGPAQAMAEIDRGASE